MAKINFRFTIDADGWATVEADTLEECREQLHDLVIDHLNLEDTEAGIKHISLSNIEEEIVEKTVIVEVEDVEYDITEDDIEFGGSLSEDEVENEIKKISDSLPHQFKLEVTTTADEKYLDEDVEDQITLQTDWLVRSVKYKVVGEK